MRAAPATLAERPASGAPTIADHLRAVAPHIPPALIARDCLDDMADIAELLPAALTTHFGFECRLGEAAPAADFLFATTIALGGREILGGRHAGIPAPPILRHDPRWERARAFCETWADPASRLHDRADHVWFEFDIAGPPAARRIPNMFLSPQAPDEPRSRVALVRDTVEEGLQLLAGGALLPASVTTIRALMDALPPDTWVFQVGVMGARTPAPARLQFSSITAGDFLATLERMRWSGPIAALGQAIDALAPFAADITYAIDVHGQLGPKVGLECYIPDDDARRWAAFLDHLVERGLCLPTKRDALLAFPGITYEHNDPEHWPAHLARASRLLGGGRIPVLTRCQHHIKVVALDGLLVEAKAYPGVALHWVDRSA